MADTQSTAYKEKLLKKKKKTRARGRDKKRPPSSARDKRSHPFSERSFLAQAQNTHSTVLNVAAPSKDPAGAPRGRVRFVWAYVFPPLGCDCDCDVSVSVCLASPLHFLSRQRCSGSGCHWPSGTAARVCIVVGVSDPASMDGSIIFDTYLVNVGILPRFRIPSPRTIVHPPLHKHRSQQQSKHGVYDYVHC